MDKGIEYVNAILEVVVERIGEMAAGSRQMAEEYIRKELLKAYSKGFTDAHRKETEVQ